MKWEKTENSILLFKMQIKNKNKIQICITDSLCYTIDTNTTL